MRLVFAVLLILGLSSAVALGQVSNAIAGVVNEGGFPSLRFSPGQLLSLGVYGLKAPESQATSLPLPTLLSGVRVVLSGMGADIDLPILKVTQMGCPTVVTSAPGGSGGGTCSDKAVIVQIPPGLPFNVLPRFPFGYPTIQIYENGVAGQPKAFSSGTSTTTILTSCSFLVYTRNPVGCDDRSLVTRGDGTAVPRSGVRAGDVLTAYAIGLGATNPIMAPAVATPTAAPTVSRYYFRFFFREAPTRTETSWIGEPPAGWEAVQYSGLTPGYVGLYQINFRVPDGLPIQEPTAGQPCTFLGVAFSDGFSADTTVGVCVTK